MRIQIDTENRVIIFPAETGLMEVSKFLSKLEGDLKNYKYYKPLKEENQEEQYQEWLKLNNG